MKEEPSTAGLVVDLMRIESGSLPVPSKMIAQRSEVVSARFNHSLSPRGPIRQRFSSIPDKSINAVRLHDAYVINEEQDEENRKTSKFYRDDSSSSETNRDTIKTRECNQNTVHTDPRTKTRLFESRNPHQLGSPEIISSLSTLTRRAENQLMPERLMARNISQASVGSSSKS